MFVYHNLYMVLFTHFAFAPKMSKVLHLNFGNKKKKKQRFIQNNDQKLSISMFYVYLCAHRTPLACVCVCACVYVETTDYWQFRDIFYHFLWVRTTSRKEKRFRSVSVCWCGVFSLWGRAHGKTKSKVPTIINDLNGFSIWFGSWCFEHSPYVLLLLLFSIDLFSSFYSPSTPLIESKHP